MNLNEEGTNNFVNQSLLNYYFSNRKTKKGCKKSANKYSKLNIIDEKISLTEHSNILNEYKDELKFLSLKRKNPESLDNSQIFKEASTRESDIVICVDNRTDEQNYEEKEFKINNNENQSNIFDLLNLNNSLFNKIGPNFKKISSFIETSNFEKQKNNYYQEKEKTYLDDLKKIANNIDNKKSFINYFINLFYHSNLVNGAMENLIELINNLIINNNSKNSSLNDSFNIDFNKESSDNNFNNKKDKFSHLKTLNEKVSSNNYPSLLSLTSDNDYFKSIMSIYNKYSSNGEKTEKNLTKLLLEENLKLYNKLKNVDKNEGEKFDLNILKTMLTNKQIRKKVKSNFKFMKSLKKIKFNSIPNLDVINNKISSLINSQDEPKDSKILKKLDKPDTRNFFLLIYFLIGAIYINNSNSFLSENELFSFIPYFMSFWKKKSAKIQKKKKKKFKKINKVEQSNNIIRINLEDL